MDGDRRIVDAHCNSCMQETRHFVLESKDQCFRKCDEQGNCVLEENLRWLFLECCGCQEICLSRLYSSSAEPEPQVDYFPPIASRAMPKWMTRSLPMLFYSDGMYYFLLREIYSSISAGSFRLTVLGARAVLEAVFNDKVGDIDGFGKKLKEMQQRGFVSQQEADFLDAALDAGHAVMHRGFVPKAEDANKVMDIVEHLMESVYSLQIAGKKLRDVVPPRKIPDKK